MLFDLPSITRRLKPLARHLLPHDGNGNSHPQAEEAPLRDELFSIDQLDRHARDLAHSHQVSTARAAGPDKLLKRLSSNEKVLGDAYKLVTRAVAGGHRITPAAEWFLDNYHLIEEQIRIARRHFPRGYSRELPRLIEGAHDGFPRVYAIALEIISHVDGRVDAESLSAFVKSYQQVSPLKLGELWAIPIMLRLALLENLRRVVARVASGRRDREIAAHWLDRMFEVAGAAPGNVVVVLAEMIKSHPPLSTAFIAEFASRVQGRGQSLVFPLTWLEHRVAEQGQTVEAVFQTASQNQAADQVSIGNSIGSLRFLGAMEWRDFVESMSGVEQILRTDPAGVYPAMEFATRDQYRHAVEKIAKYSTLSETDVAQKSVELAKDRADLQSHVGYFLIGKGQRTLEQAARMRPTFGEIIRRAAARAPLTGYVGSILFLTTLITAVVLLIGARHRLPTWAMIISIPLLFTAASQLALAMVHWAVMLLVHPRPLPRLDFSKGIPPEHAAIVAVPAMLTDAKEIDDLIEALEVRFLANRDANLYFALISDFKDAESENAPNDEALLNQAREGIESLNAKYTATAADRFFLFHRARKWNVQENCWMGWERKRGKLEDFNATLRGKEGRFATIVGSTDNLKNVRYVITLDSDTQLPRDTAWQLIGTMAHPLNRPRYDEKLGRVTSGYGILQPRVGVNMPSANRSPYARLFSGDPGIDPYTRVVSDVYQDVFEEGSFIGKGIYDLEAFDRAVGGRLPTNHILSHDLIEGAHARSGLVSDVSLFEDFPSAYPVDVNRRSRWIRGDWQILPWLLPRVPGPDQKRIANPISRLSRWKILDNIRRSLVPEAMTALLILGWFVPEVALLFTLSVIGILFLPALFNGAVDLLRKPKDLPLHQHARLTFLAMSRQMMQQAFALATLPYDALVNLEAICRTLARLFITRKRLLEWQTARDAHRTTRIDLPGFYTSMWILPGLAIVVALSLFFRDRGSLAVAGPILGLWLASPAIAFALSRPRVRRRPHLSAEDIIFLEGVARRTWRFFETFVGLVDNFLPPDNFQEDPPNGVAHRTSPTNIGMYLLSTLTAYDFGYIPAGDVIVRVKQTLATLDKLQRHRGHFYNWYDTRTLEPLRPLYVSTVDSGNLAAHLLTLASGLEDLINHKIFRPAVFAGMRSSLDLLPPVLRERLRNPPTKLSDARALLKELIAEAAKAKSTADKEPAEQLSTQCKLALADLDELAPAATDVIPTFAEAAQSDSASSEAAAERVRDLQQLAIRCREMADIDYSFLYDKNRHLLSIGYNVAERRLDSGFYDLLASEARLGSYVAIAQGKLPREHWFHLGRALTNTGDGLALVSWSGSMFEYLMPLLVMPTEPNTLLDQTYVTVVNRQIRYGRERHVPWGISESGYTKTDAHLNYQYQAFGVPGLGYKRGLAEDLVIAPYSSVMALMVAPERACANLRRLADEDRLSTYGFYEAIDYTPSRLPRGQESAPVRSYMAHHQGMSLLSLSYLLHDRPMQRRFQLDRTFLATDLLLQERVPKTPSVSPHPAETSHPQGVQSETGSNFRVFTTAHTAVPEVHLLSNGRYHVAVTAAGGGYSRWRDLAITRWREDTTRDCWGTFCYLRDTETGQFWSSAFQPTDGRPSSYEAIYSQGRAEFRRRDGDIEIHVEISVSPEDDIELRRVSISNRGRSARTIEVTTYAEVVLAPAAADASHPAFSNLFVQTQLIRERQAILCTRRARSASEKPPWMLHLMSVYGDVAAAASYETSRAEFVGRGRTLADPLAMDRDALTGSEGSVLDPIVSIRNTVLIESDQTVQLHMVTGAAETQEAALSLIEKYHDRRLADRVFDLAWTHSQVVLRQLDAKEVDAQLFGRLASKILYASPLLRASGSIIARNKRGQSGLWGYGISGDLPIVLLRVGDIAQINLVRQLVQAHAYWRVHGLAVDLVIWNEDQSGYRQALHEEITAVITSRSESNLLDKPAGIFIRRLEQISDEDKVLMQTVARVIISDTAGTLAEQMDRRFGLDVPVPRFRSTRARRAEIPVGVEITPRQLSAFNGIGGFTQDGREYIITTTAASPTPAPWVNVLANQWFGTVVSESGGAYTWCENAQTYRMTPWYNDAVTDTTGEAFYLRDEENGQFWSPAPLPARGAMPYTTRHGFGYTIFEYAEDGIISEMRIYVALDAPIKFVTFKIRNNSGRPRRLSITGFFELVLGDRRETHAPHIVTELDPKTGALLARNAYNNEFAERVVFLDSSESRRTVSGDRGEILGRNGSAASPSALFRARLSGRVGAGFDPCAAMQVGVELADGQEREVAFTFGSGRDLADARNLVNRFRGTGAARAAMEAVWNFWNRTLGIVYVETPDASLNFLANGWLLYQVLASRIWGRSGFYQSGGAYGFRDQLQDCMALVHAQPSILRAQILRCASRQFREGDVQHWWHPTLGRGVRTRISDDYLWLPYATCRYVTAMGDTGVLDEKVAYLEGRPVQPNEDSYYDLPIRSEETSTLYEHCVRSIRHGLRFGEHGLPLMGGGDWNDGMNLVGEHGKGESVWLAFFLYDVLIQFAHLAHDRSDELIATLCTTEAEKLRLNIEDHAWDGQWYKRAYFDDGTPLGSSTNPECRIDSLPQSWSILSNAGQVERSQSAMAQVNQQLVRRDINIIQLFDPPFDHSSLNPGYIKGYVPGVRENGGQYTHAAIWTVMAFAAAGDRDRAWELFNMINPVNHGNSQTAIEKYKVEPYVVAADVYATPAHAGRGGWTWYTGSAGWMYRLITESFLGLHLQSEHLTFAPCLPAAWKSYKIHYRFYETTYHITIQNTGSGKKVKRISSDGSDLPDKRLPLINDRREHAVEVELE